MSTQADANMFHLNDNVDALRQEIVQLKAKLAAAATSSSATNAGETNSLQNNMKHHDILIIGAGPTGLGALARLSQQSTSPNCHLIEARDGPGGLAYTTTTKEGFMFDTGGHVIFSHYTFFDELINTAVGGDGPEHWNTLKRVSHVRMNNTWIPYPFQNNLTFLSLEEQETCLLGAIDATAVAATATSKPKDFDEWILRVMGEGIANIFMRPYNFKVWACPPSTMQCSWLGERVATVNAKQLVSDVLHKRAAQQQWGPNAMFRFPTTGGTGQIWKDVANNCCGNKEAQQYDTKVIHVDTNTKQVTIQDLQGQTSIVTYNKMLTTMPLDQFLTLCDNEIKNATIDQWNTNNDMNDKPNENEKETKKNQDDNQEPPIGCVYSSSHIIGLGIRGTHEHGDKCWQYFPDDNCPFYRCTVFTNYSKDHAPNDDVMLPTIINGDGSVPNETASKAGPYWSLMLEVSESKKYKPVNTKKSKESQHLPQVVYDTIIGCMNTGMIKSTDEIVSIHYERLEYGYPTPSLGRDAALEVALPLLKSKDIWSRGRFGAWKYEVANQDHSCMQGVEAIDNILHGSLETTVSYPSIVNKRGGKNEDIHYEKKMG